MSDRRFRPVLILQLLIPILIAVAGVAGYIGLERRLGILQPDRIIGIDDLPGISKTVFGPGCSTLPKYSQHLFPGHEHIPALLLNDADLNKGEHALLMGSQSLSSVIARGEGELLLVSQEDGLLILDAQGSTVGKGWRPVAYDSVKSAALIPEVGLVICATGTPEKLLVFSSINSWQDLLDAFKKRP